MPETVAREKVASVASRGDGRSERHLPALRVRYYRQLTPQRVHTAEVYWQKSGEPARGEITVRLLAAGAQVVPAEQTMDCSKPDATAVFYVTPLAKGWLRNEKIEVLANNRKVQEIPLASKVVGQKFTWFLLLCTLLVPWCITEFIKHSPMAQTSRLADERIVYRDVSKEVEAYIKDNVPSLPKSWKGGTVDTGLKDARSWVAQRYQQLVQVSTIEPIAFYVACVLLALTLVSAYLHMPKRCRATGKPIPVSVLSAT
jgi:hypothetical protein